MKLELKAASTLAPVLTTQEEFQNSNHSYFCISCNTHREEFKPEECLRLYQHNTLGLPIFAGFICPNCFRLEVAATQLEVAEEAAELAHLKEELKLCAECGLLPAANPETELCQECINDFEEWRAICLVEKLSPYTPA